MASVKTEIGAEIKDKKGELIKVTPFRECHSLLKGFIQVLAVGISQVFSTIKDTGGTDRAIYWDGGNFRMNAVAQTTFGILIGTGNTAVTMADNALETQLTTDIAHNTVSFAVENPDAATWRVAIGRGFVNNTGAAVTIKEVAAYGYMGGSFIGCMDRTLYEVTFEAGETLTLTYRITATL